MKIKQNNSTQQLDLKDNSMFTLRKSIPATEQEYKHQKHVGDPIFDFLHNLFLSIFGLSIIILAISGILYIIGIIYFATNDKPELAEKDMPTTLISQNTNNPKKTNSSLIAFNEADKIITQRIGKVSFTDFNISKDENMYNITIYLGNNAMNYDKVTTKIEYKNGKYILNNLRFQ